MPDVLLESKIRVPVELAESGRYRPVRERTYELTEIVDAHHLVDSGHKRGNVVLRVAADLAA